jgi:secondary thiamine-phosphate synthase enzyme
MIYSRQLELDSDGGFSVINVTEDVRGVVRDSGIANGQVLVYYMHTTGAVLIGEHEPGIVADVQRLLEELTPLAHDYYHHRRAVDYNGHAHVRAAIMPVCVTVPLLAGHMQLGTYQEILVYDFQTERAPRTLIVQIMGEL